MRSIDYSPNVLSKLNKKQHSLQNIQTSQTLNTKTDLQKKATIKHFNHQRIKTQSKPDITELTSLKYSVQQLYSTRTKLTPQSKSQENIKMSFKKNSPTLNNEFMSEQFINSNSSRQSSSTKFQNKLLSTVTPRSNQTSSVLLKESYTSRGSKKVQTLQDEKKSYLFDNPSSKNLKLLSEKTVIPTLLKSIQQSILEPSPLTSKSVNQKMIKVSLSYKSQILHYKIIYQDRTCKDLFLFLREKVIFIENANSSGQMSKQMATLDSALICQFTSVQNNVALDYYLSRHENTLNNLTSSTLLLQPLYSIACGDKVGLKDFPLIKCIGVGGFSRVYLVKKRDTGKFYALKLIDKKFITDNHKENIVENERDIMAKLDNEFVTTLHYAFETKFYIAFVMEYCSGGELFYHLRRQGKLSEDDAKFYFAEICFGMAYLHQNGIVYRDVKPENILLDMNGHLLMSDFGLSKPNMEGDVIAHSFCGSPEYMAPEMLLKSGHNYLVDCYCLGALLYELVTGLPPFYSYNTQEIYDSILSEDIKFPPDVAISAPLKNLIRGLLVKEPTKRIGTKQGVIEILTHPWFKNISFEVLLSRQTKPPFTPELLQYNFDQEEFKKGDADFRKQYHINMQKEYSEAHSPVFKKFYFSRAPGKQKFPAGHKKHQTYHHSQNLLPPSPYKKNNLFSQKKVMQSQQIQFSDEILKQRILNSPRKNISQEAQIFTQKQSDLNTQVKVGGHTYSKTVLIPDKIFPRSPMQSDQRKKSEVRMSPSSVMGSTKNTQRFNQLQADIEKQSKFNIFERLN